MDTAESPATLVTTDTAVEIKEELQEDVSVIDEGPESSPVSIANGHMSPENVTYHVVAKCSEKGAEKLFSSDGYSYRLSKIGATGFQTWLCVKKSPKTRCQAKVQSRKYDAFDTMGTTHCHPPFPEEYALAKLKIALKHKALKHPTKSTTKMVKKLLPKYLPSGPEEWWEASVDRLANLANRHRRRILEKSKKNNPGVPTSSGNGFDTQMEVPTMAPATSSVDLAKTRKRNRKQTMKVHKSKKKKSRVPADVSVLTIPDSLAPSSSGGTDVLNKNDYIAIYVPKKCFKKMLKEGLRNTDLALVSLGNSSQKPAEKVFTEVCREHQFENGSLLSEHSTSTPIVSSGAKASKADPDDMFFRSIAAEVKEMPKLLKSTLKLEILTSVNTALQNLSANSALDSHAG